MKKKLYSNTVPEGEYIMVEHVKKKKPSVCNDKCKCDLPIASYTTLGGIKVGNGLVINPTTGVLSVDSSSGVAVNNGKLTITTGGIASGGGNFTANQSFNTNITISVPTTLSSYINDIGFLTTESDPTVPSHVKAISISDINLWNTVGISSDLGNSLTLGSDGKVYYSTPVIPIVNDGELTISTSGISTGGGSFTANQSSNTSITIDTPGTDITLSLDGTILEVDSSTGTGDTIDLSSILPSIGNGTLTLNTTSDLTGSATFTANQSSNSTFTVGLSAATFNDINDGLTAYSWGNHALAGYLTTETDPTVPSWVKAISTTDISNWGDAYSWGDHALAGYLTSETDPTVPSHVKVISTGDISNWNDAYSWGDHAGLYRPITWTPNLQEVTNEGNITTNPFVKTTGTTHRIVTNPVAFHTLGSPQSTGCIVIKHPIVTGATFVEMEITVNGYQDSAGRLIKYYLTFYHTSSSINGAWNLRAVVLGNNIPSGGTTVRVGIDGTDIVVALGEVTTNWNNAASGLAVEVDKIRLSHTGSNNNAWNSNWSIVRNITDTSGYSPFYTIPTEIVATQAYISSSVILSGTYNMSATSISANSQSTIGTATITGASVNNPVEVTQPSVGLLYKGRVTASNTVTIYAVNPTAAPVNTVAEVLQIKVFK